MLLAKAEQVRRQELESQREEARAKLLSRARMLACSYLQTENRGLLGSVIGLNSSLATALESFLEADARGGAGVLARGGAGDS